MTVSNVSNYENEESLLIADALEEYLGDQPLSHVKKSFENYAKMGKKGLSVLAEFVLILTDPSTKTLLIMNYL